MNEPITVITLTRERTALVERAVRSVAAQDYPGAIEHLVLADDDPEAVASLNELSSQAHRRLVPHLVARASGEHGPSAAERASVYPRCARLLNLGVRRAQSPWIAFLDDDNEYEPQHLRLLEECARARRAPAIHSARQMLWPDGSPYLEPRFPHAPERAELIYEILCSRGIWVRGTNLLLDHVDSDQTRFANSTIMSAEDPIFLVDQNVWLIRRELLLRYPIPELFSAVDVAANTCPDDKLLETLVRHDVTIASNCKPTVRYYLGGISNPHCASGLRRREGDRLHA